VSTGDAFVDNELGDAGDRGDRVADLVTDRGGKRPYGSHFFLVEPLLAHELHLPLAPAQVHLHLVHGIDQSADFVAPRVGERRAVVSRHDRRRTVPQPVDVTGEAREENQDHRDACNSADDVRGDREDAQELLGRSVILAEIPIYIPQTVDDVLQFAEQDLLGVANARQLFGAGQHLEGGDGLAEALDVVADRRDCPADVVQCHSERFQAEAKVVERKRAERDSTLGIEDRLAFHERACERPGDRLDHSDLFLIGFYLLHDRNEALPLVGEKHRDRREVADQHEHREHALGPERKPGRTTAGERGL
jgi:hypothetical protein